MAFIKKYKFCDALKTNRLQFPFQITLLLKVVGQSILKHPFISPVHSQKKKTYTLTDVKHPHLRGCQHI